MATGKDIISSMVRRYVPVELLEVWQLIEVDEARAVMTGGTGGAAFVQHLPKASDPNNFG